MCWIINLIRHTCTFCVKFVHFFRDWKCLEGIQQLSEVEGYPRFLQQGTLLRKGPLD